MTVATVTEWTDSHLDGNSALRLILTAATGIDRDRCLAQLFKRTQPAFVEGLARIDSELADTIRRHRELTASDKHLFLARRRWIAADIFDAVHRDLWHCEKTLAALAAGQTNPVHPDERRCLTTAATRPLSRSAVTLDPLSARRLTDAALAHQAAALTALAV